MRYIRYAFLAVLAILLITVALANRQAVTLQVLPPELDALMGLGTSVTLPLYAVVFAGIILGLLIGYFLEYLREGKHRKAAAQGRRDVKKLEREVKKMKAADGSDDDVLAILEKPAKAS